MNNNYTLSWPFKNNISSTIKLAMKVIGHKNYQATYEERVQLCSVASFMTSPISYTQGTSSFLPGNVLELVNVRVISIGSLFSIMDVGLRVSGSIWSCRFNNFWVSEWGLRVKYQNLIFSLCFWRLVWTVSREYMRTHLMNSKTLSHKSWLMKPSGWHSTNQTVNSKTGVAISNSYLQKHTGISDRTSNATVQQKKVVWCFNK